MSLATSTSPRYAGPPAVRGYVLHEFLGRGSCGVVWAATVDASSEPVAVKIVPAASAGHDPLAESDRERALGRAVETVHLVRARDRVVLDDGQVAVVLDLADGGSLRDVVTVRGRLPLGEVVTTLTPLASALAELHEAGIVHADVAPGNVLFARDGRPLLADLSSARLVDDDPGSDAVVGTPGFTAPEVSDGGAPTPSADVWSLGALAWYARTGGSTPPRWVGDLHWMRGNPADTRGGSLEDVTAAVGPELRPILLRMLADDPNARPSAAEAALALYRVADPEPVGLVGHHPDPAAAVTTRIRRDAAQTRSRTQLREQERADRRRRARERRRTRVERVLHPRSGGTSDPASAPGPVLTSARARGRRSLRWRLAAVALLGVALAGGMFALLRLAPGLPALATGTHSDLVRSGSGVATDGTEQGPVAGGLAGTETAAAQSRSPDPAPDSAATGSGASPASPASTATPSATGVITSGTSNAGSNGSGSNGAGVPASPEMAVTSGNTESSPAALDPAREPVAALQRVADLRAAALRAADPVALLQAEPAGSAAYQTDATAVVRLREQRQRYAELTFVVRSAELERSDAATVTLRAVVDRSAYTVVGEDGSTQNVTAAGGSTLRYTLSKTGSGWLLTDVGAA